MCTHLDSLVGDEGGATAIEYGLIAALVAIVIVSAVVALGVALGTTWNTIEVAVLGATG